MTREQWEEATDPDLSPGLPLLNKAIAGKYPPGSTFKVISACAALEQTDVTPATMANCTGRITVGRRHRAFKCWIAERGGHGWVNFYEAIGRSCNIFFYECVRQHKLDPDVILPMHCSGAGFIETMRRRMPDKLVTTNVGSRFTFGV